MLKTVTAVALLVLAGTVNAAETKLENALRFCESNAKNVQEMAKRRDAGTTKDDMLRALDYANSIPPGMPDADMRNATQLIWFIHGLPDKSPAELRKQYKDMCVYVMRQNFAKGK